MSTTPRSWDSLQRELATLLKASPGLSPDAAILCRDKFEIPEMRRYGEAMEAARAALEVAVDTAREFIRPRPELVKSEGR